MAIEQQQATSRTGADAPIWLLGLVTALVREARPSSARPLEVDWSWHVVLDALVNADDHPRMRRFYGPEDEKRMIVSCPRFQY